jgi:hypothetical protein
MKKTFAALLLFVTAFVFAQTKVSGIVVDNTNQPIPFANVVFKNSNEGIVTNEDGRFYIESPKTYTAVIVSFIGFQTKEVPLPKAVNYNFKIQLSEGEQLKEVVVYSGKTSKKTIRRLISLEKSGNASARTVCICSTSTRWRNTRKSNLT